MIDPLLSAYGERLLIERTERGEERVRLLGVLSLLFFVTREFSGKRRVDRLFAQRVEERVEPKVLALREGVVLVIVTLRTAKG